MVQKRIEIDVVIVQCKGAGETRQAIEGSNFGADREELNE